MQSVKRIEIIVDSPEVPALLAVLKSVGVTGYTVYEQLWGSGDRGERRNDEPGGGGNACVLTTTTAADLPRLIETVRPILRRRGGLCLVSDAHLVMH